MFPFVNLALGATSCAIFHYWGVWNNRRAERTFVFSEMNFFKNKNYQTFLLSPLSFENSFFFYTNLPGLLYAGYLIERKFGSKVLMGAYLLNCTASALTTTVVHRKIGYHEVQRRGRFSNTNGNLALYLVSLFTTCKPDYRLYYGKYMATNIYFGYLMAAYLVLYFTTHLVSGVKTRHVGAQNHNETHYVAVALGVMSGVMLKRRL